MSTVVFAGANLVHEGEAINAFFSATYIICARTYSRFVYNDCKPIASAIVSRLFNTALLPNIFYDVQGKVIRISRRIYRMAKLWIWKAKFGFWNNFTCKCVISNHSDLYLKTIRKRPQPSQDENIHSESEQKLYSANCFDIWQILTNTATEMLANFHNDLNIQSHGLNTRFCMG